MGVINIFGGDGLWTFFNLIIEWYWLIVVSARWLASQDCYLVRRTWRRNLSLRSCRWHIKYVFDILVDVINIFGGDGVWTFITFIHWMILVDCCERSVDGLTRLLSSPYDVEAEYLFAMLSLTSIIYCIYLNDLDWSLWALYGRPHCERSMAGLI